MKYVVKSDEGCYLHYEWVDNQIDASRFETAEEARAVCDALPYAIGTVVKLVPPSKPNKEAILDAVFDNWTFAEGDAGKPSLDDVLEWIEDHCDEGHCEDS